MAPPRKNSPFRLIVEGRDDKWSVINLLSRYGFDWQDPDVEGRPFVHHAGGVERLLSSVVPAVKSHPRVGFVLDADDDLENRWQQITDRLMEAGLEVPSDPPTDGLVIDGYEGDGKVGVWLMPDNRIPGELEDFIISLVPDDDPLIDFADEVTTEARAKGAPCTEGDHAKSTIHTWLAWQAKPGQPFGVALTSETLSHDSEIAQRFVHWFTRLFAVEDSIDLR